MEHNSSTINIGSSTIIRFLLFIGLAILLFYLRDLLLVILTAIVIASAIEPAVLWFDKNKVPRLPAVAIIYLLVAIFFVGAFYFLVPPLIDDTIGFLSKSPEIFNSFGLSGVGEEDLVGTLQNFSSIFSLEEIIGGYQNIITGVSGGFIQGITSIFGGALSFVLILVLSFYFAVNETGIDDFLRVITPLRYQDYVVNLWRRAQFKIGLWMQGQILLALIVGVLVYLGLTILGVPYAFLLAIVSALFELIPVFGPILAAIPGILVAFGDAGVGSALAVGALYLIIQQFENHLIYPLVVRKVVGVPPLLVIIGLVAGGKLAGFLGIILSVPFAAALKELVDDIQRNRAKGKEGVNIQ